ncbi:unnamed protein product [Phytomonas sp. Hart1]|nr:unnamed protein product [Phytomonas sp. Hart1]|eukprot:CCW70593.1 unnamed protein product [Phytomonas sp. isolate Hart1]
MPYVVFSVENADRLILMQPPLVPKGFPTFKQIALSYIHAPKQSRRTLSGGFSPEEPCARDAAELIRVAFIGKQVKFEEDYVIEELKRNAGRLQLLTGEDASVMLLEAGLAEVSENLPQKMKKPLNDQYMDLMKAAKKAQKGIFHPKAASRVRQMREMTVSELTKLVQVYNGKELLVRIERAISALVLIISSTEFGDTQIPVHLAGIYDILTEDNEVGMQAKLHTECFLLNRNVNIRFDGTDDRGNILVSIISRKGSFQEELLSKGLAKVDGRDPSVPVQHDKLVKAEAEAKRQRLGIWKNFVENAAKDAEVPDGGYKISAGPPKTAKNELLVVGANGASGVAYNGPVNFTGRLIQVVQGDTIVVREEDTKRYTRLTLSGIRSSKNIVRDQNGGSPECRVSYYEYAWEAKEFLRTRFLGARVVVSVDYARVIPETNEVRPAASVTVLDSGVNIGAALLEEGYAVYFLGRSDVCMNASLLQAAEQEAKARKRGLHGDQPRPTTILTELGRIGESKGRYYLSFFQRGMQGGRPPTLKGVVDLVLGPAFFRVFIPKENFQIPLKLAGVIAPSAALRSNMKDDPFAEEAKDFVTCLIQQREVNLQVYTSDRGGNFIASVMLPNGTNVSLALVEEGLATVGNADGLPFVDKLFAAEEDARSAKKNIWSGDGSIPQRAAKVEAEQRAAISTQLVLLTNNSSSSTNYTISEVSEDGLSVYLQEYGLETDEKKAQIQDLINRTVSASVYLPKKKGELLVAEYKPEKLWCRASVVKILKNKDAAEVHYIDFGNTCLVSTKHIRSIPDLHEYDIVRKTPPFAKLVYLAFLKKEIPTTIAIRGAADIIYEYSDRDIKAHPMYKDCDGSAYYMITVSNNQKSLSEILLQHGYAILDKRTASLFPSEYKRHEAAQETARKEHKALWQYGDINDDDDFH